MSDFSHFIWISNSPSYTQVFSHIHFADKSDSVKPLVTVDLEGTRLVAWSSCVGG